MKGDMYKREYLDDVIWRKTSAENWYTPDLFEEFTRAKLPLELDMIKPPLQEELNYNCYIYALSLRDDPRFLGNDNWEFTRKLDKDFDEMIKLGLLKPLGKPEAGCLVLWRTDEQLISHVGLMEDGEFVISKWSWGPLFRHHIYDVPASYGDTVEFYTGLSEAMDYVEKQRENY